MISERTLAKSFPSFWEELLPLLNSRYMAVFNEVQMERLHTNEGVRLELLDLHPLVQHPDLVAEFAFRLAAIAFAENLSPLVAAESSDLVSLAESDAVRLINRYEGSQPAHPPRLTEIEINEGLRLADRYTALYRAVGHGSSTQFCPKLRGAGILGSVEADIAIGSTLVEVKTTTKSPSRRDLRQLVIYMALDRLSERNAWSDIAIFNPRRGVLHRIPFEDCVRNISGGRASTDVCSDLLEFLENHEFIRESAF